MSMQPSLRELSFWKLNFKQWSWYMIRNLVHGSDILNFILWVVLGHFLFNGCWNSVHQLGVQISFRTLKLILTQWLELVDDLALRPLQTLVEERDIFFWPMTEPCFIGLSSAFDFPDPSLLSFFKFCPIYEDIIIFFETVRLLCVLDAMLNPGLACLNLSLLNNLWLDRLVPRWE